MAGNPFQQLSDLYSKPVLIPGEVSQITHLTPDDKQLIRRIGLSTTQVRRDLQQDTQIFYDRYNLYHHVEQALEHTLVGAATELYANYCCLTGDTKIPLLDGRVLTIKEILREQQEGKENWVYSCDYNGKPQPSKIVHAVKQKHTPKTFRVWLDNGKYVDASDNHKFMKRDGSLCRADKLEVGDSLMPFDRQKKENSQTVVWDVDAWEWEHIHKASEPLKKLSSDKRKEFFYYRKITKIECIGEKEVYDIEVSGSHLFGLDVGIYIKNTVFSPLHNATIWITSESATYQRELTKLLDRIGIEERIFDWAFTSGSYGDMFVKVTGIPGQGVISVDDSDHPINISRVDHEGILIGYYKSPLGQTTEAQQLLPPWNYVHFRLLGGKKQRPRSGDQNYSEFRTVHLLTGLRSKQVTTRYGTSLLLNALPIYRRLRLAEDSLLLARLSRGLIRYIWKLKVNHNNAEAVGELMDQYGRVLREARALDPRADSANFDSKENPMAAIEDILLPVWDDVGDLTYDKIGGEADIRWIKDIEDLRQQLAAALRTPLPLLGAWLKEATGPLGSQAIEKVDINFARMARKLQRTVRNGVKRICQIHLAYMNMDPDPNLFDVQMPEMSTAEEESLKESLREGAGVVSDLMDVIEKATEGENRQLDKMEIFNYFNQKFLKLEDFDLKDFIISSQAIPECKRRTERMAHEQKVKQIIEKAMSTQDKERFSPKPVLWDTDLVSYVPTRTCKKDGSINESAVTKLGLNGGWLGVQRSMEEWEKRFANVTITEGEFDKDVDNGQLTLPFAEDK